VWPSQLFHRVRFDERLLYGSDEVDVSYAAIAAGYRICPCPEAINVHRPSPIGRDAYPIQAHVSRLRATSKRHWNGRHRLANTAAFLALAPLHLLIGLLKRQGLRGFATYARAMRAWLLGNRPKTTI
jgi:GT2 family glycosyltransferase